jgi:hypothetical protein
MAGKTLLTIVAIVVTAFLCTSVAQQPAPMKIPNAIEGQQPQLLQLAVLPGRYQITGMGNTGIVLVDTHTGQCWSGSTGSSRWYDMGSPVKAKE